MKSSTNRKINKERNSYEILRNLESCENEKNVGILNFDKDGDNCKENGSSDSRSNFSHPTEVDDIGEEAFEVSQKSERGEDGPVEPKISKAGSINPNVSKSQEEYETNSENPEDEINQIFVDGLNHDEEDGNYEDDNTSENEVEEVKVISFLPRNTKIPRGKISRGIEQLVPLPFLSPKFTNYWIKVTTKKRKIERFYGLRQFLEMTGGKGTRNYRNLELAIDRFGTQKFYKSVLPNMLIILRKSAFEFKGTKLGFLTQGKNASLSLTRVQCCVILVNAFFSTFRFYDMIQQQQNSHWNFGKKLNEWGLPNINFKKLFNIPHDKCVIHKIMCFLNYFELVFTKKDQEMDSIIEFERKHEVPSRVLRDFKLEMGRVLIPKKGSIEECKNARHMDFANCYMGGGVLGFGCVQEEIRFCVSPECVVGLLFCPCLLDTEAIVIRGTERFSRYSGYGESFRFRGPEKDSLCGTYEICAMDALNFGGGQGEAQLERSCLRRELWKSYVAFKDCQYPTIATGHWGCGAFRGNKGLKFVIQWISASVNQRILLYYSFGDTMWRKKFRRFVEEVKKSEYTVDQVYKAVFKLERWKGDRYLQKYCLDALLQILDKKKKKKMRKSDRRRDRNDL